MDTPPAQGARQPLIARAAMRVTAREGLRGLTHRAVDREAGLAQGSTSYYARSRARLLQLTLEQLAADEERLIAAAAAGAAPTALSRPAVADLLADFVLASIAAAPERTLARFEMALEAVRRPELRAVYDRIGAGFRTLAADILRELGSPTPERHARSLIAWCEGMALDSLAGSGAAQPPDAAELRSDAAELLEAVLGPPGAG